MNTDALNWLLECGNPAVQYRTRTALLEQEADVRPAKDWIYGWLPKDWFEANGLWYVYYITALAECGLTKADIPCAYMEKALRTVNAQLEYGCGDFMLLTALAKLGFDVLDAARSAARHMLPDGGFLCLRRANRLKYTPKSCYKANLHALMLLSECGKQGMAAAHFQALVDYFLGRGIFYKSADRAALVLDGREGWRTIDAFYPFEVMRVGIQNVVESLAALGLGSDERLRAAWDLLNSQRDAQGRVILRGTPTKSYLPKEKIGKPSQWATFYALLAEKHCAGGA